MKKLLIALVLSLSLMGCGDPSKRNLGDQFYYIDDAVRLDIYVDRKTGLHYLQMSGGGITPRLNRDGTLYSENEVQTGETGRPTYTQH